MNELDHDRFAIKSMDLEENRWYRKVASNVPASVISRASHRPDMPEPTIALLPVISYAVAMSRDFEGLVIIKQMIKLIEVIEWQR